MTFEAPALRATQIPVNPTDPIIIINGQVITRQQLADECVARKGKEIAELMINRTLVEQALRAKKLEVTAAEIDQEIDTVAKRFGIGREGWLRTLDKERGISPMQYARDIIYPALALRKLCAGRVQVTPKDMQQAFEAQYAEKIRCRMILVDTQTQGHGDLGRAAQEPRRLREDRHGTIDGHRQPVARRAAGRADHAPRLSADAHRRGVPATGRRRPGRQRPEPQAEGRQFHRPDPGQRNGLDHPSPRIARSRRSQASASKDEQVRKQTYEMIYEVKLKETMGAVMQELIKAAAIENQLTGTVKLANEEKDPSYGVDGDVKLMSNPPATKARPQAPARSRARCRRGKIAAPPVGLSPEAVREFEKIRVGRQSGSAATKCRARSEPAHPLHRTEARLARA